MKAVKILLGIIGIFFLMIWGIGSYLGPDDLGRCSSAPTSTTQCGSADAIVAISGGDTDARASEAIKLYQQGWAPIIIFSGAAADKTGPSNALVMKQQALDAGISSQAILIEENSETTSENATETKTIFTDNNIKSVILVTSAYHQRRASLEFHKNTGDILIRNHPVQTDKHWDDLWWLSARGWSLALAELFSSWYVWVGGVDRSS